MFGGCAYVVALTAVGSTSWALLHPSSWAGEPITLGEIPADEIMFVAILGFLGLLLLGGVETGVRAMRTRRRPEQFVRWRLRLLSLAQATAGLAFLVFGGQRLFGGALMQGTWSFLPWILPAALGFPALHVWTRYYKRRFGELPGQIVQGSGDGVRLSVRGAARGSSASRGGTGPQPASGGGELPQLPAVAAPRPPAAPRTSTSPRPVP